VPLCTSTTPRGECYDDDLSYIRVHTYVNLYDHAFLSTRSALMYGAKKW
jgi:hypothetical protein